MKISFKNILNKLEKGVKLLLRPITECFAFFGTMWSLITTTTFGYMFAYINSWPSVKDALKFLCVAVVVDYACTLVVASAPKGRIRALVKTFFLGLALALVAIYTFLWFNFEMKISPHVLTLVTETNSTETSEFFSSYMTTKQSIIAYCIIGGTVLLTLLVQALGSRINAAFSRLKWLRLSVSAIVVFAMTIGLWNSYMFVTLPFCKNSAEMDEWETKHEPWPADLLSSCIYSYHSLRAARGDVNYAIEQSQEVYKTSYVLDNENDSLNVILVLGESYIKWHTPLYGYDLNTTPNLVAERDEGNLFVFNDVISPYNATSVAEKNTFSCNSMCEGEKWFDKPMFPTVFRHAGFNVYFWDMQRDYQKHKMYTMTVNAYVYNRDIMRMSYTDTVERRLYYDMDLVTNFRDSAHVALAKHNLIMFHLLGQHVNAGDRFPKGERYRRFDKEDVTITGDWLDDDKRQYIADYDNATYYNDAVLKSIFDLYRDKNTVVIYYSDHGDEAYDYRDQKGRFGHENPDSLHLKYQNDVPFMVWCSDTYKKRHPEVVEQLRKAVDRPFMIDNACQVLFSVAGLRTPYYIARRDPLNDAFKPVNRVVYYKYDYDSRRWPEKTLKKELKTKK